MPEEIAKSQAIRLLDVYALGPFMLYLALKSGGPSAFARLTLAGIGVATILYNLKNYREQAAAELARAAETFS